ncbi:MAG: hypothetical protein JNJ40_05395 [Bacteroidia bacterium]|nr:hypothetical protein [Bacteroidia bacterium]
MNLEFTKIYEIDNWENGRTGLFWTLSFLGAELKKDSLEHAITKTDSTKFNLNFSKLGFSETGLIALNKICDSLKKTEEYKVKQTVDLGAFVSLALGSSEHYYNITGVERDFFKILDKHKNEEPIIFPVTRSLVSKHTRILKLYAKGAVTDWLFVAEEGEGDFFKNTFTAKAYEVFDIMQNGQLRFAIYDQNGKIINASPKNLSDAGKPAKCLWCHEIVIQPLYTNNDSIKGSVTQAEFQELVKEMMFKLDLYRKNLNSEIDYSKTQDHSLAERLYIGYMEPSLMKLSKEWNIPVTKLKDILKKNRTHLYPEYPFFGDIYYRDSVNSFAPFTSCIKPFNVREQDANSPDFINKK